MKETDSYDFCLFSAASSRPLPHGMSFTPPLRPWDQKPTRSRRNPKKRKETQRGGSLYKRRERATVSTTSTFPRQFLHVFSHTEHLLTPLKDLVTRELPEGKRDAKRSKPVCMQEEIHAFLGFYLAPTPPIHTLPHETPPNASLRPCDHRLIRRKKKRDAKRESN